MFRLRKHFFILLFLFFCLKQSNAQSLIMNEVSNGTTGNQEYVEFVVVSNTVTYSCTSNIPPCIDIRGWIFDDNSGYHGASGIAVGAVRFSQNPIWACVPLGTIILIYNDGDRNPAIPPDDITMSDNNCRIIAPLNSTLFETNLTTPGAVACSYPATGWTSGGNWINTVLANTGDCARIVNLAGCEVFSVCYGTDNQNTQIYFFGSGSQRVYYFNDVDPTNQANWTSGSASTNPGDQTPGAPNNAANANYIGQFNNFCQPITPLIVTASSTNAGCTCNGSANATATGSIAGYTFEWYDSNFNPIGQSGANATGLCGGNYYVIGTSHIGCSDTAMVTLTSTSTTTLAVNSQIICSGATTNLTATPSVSGGTFLWAPGGETTQTISLTPTLSSTYTCTYFTAGCSTAATGSVTVNQTPLVTVNSSTICSGSSATLTATPSILGGNYLWSPGGQTTDFISVNPNSTSSYLVTYSINGCTATGSNSVIVNLTPTIVVNSQTICSGQLATLTANGGTTYLWNDGSTSSSIAVAPLSTTVYSVTGSTNGCSSSATTTVTVNNSPTIVVNSPSICNGQQATLLAQGGTTYLWSNGATTNSINVSPIINTTYSVTGTALGCSATATSIVTIAANLIVNAGIDDTICTGNSTQLSANSNASATLFSWSPIIGLNNSTASNPIATPISTITYTVVMTDANGCTGSDRITVYIEPIVSVAVTPTDLTCNGNSSGKVSVTSSGGYPPYNFAWSNGCAANTCNNLISGFYSVVVTDKFGCTSSASAFVNEPSPIVVTTINNLPTTCFASCNGTATLSASGGTGVFNYIWNTLPLQLSNLASGLCAGNYLCKVTDSNGCLNSTSVQINQPLPVSLSSIVSTTACNSGTNLSTQASGGNGPYNYSWSPSIGLNSSIISNPIAQPISATDYSVIATDINGCTSSPQMITVRPTLPLSLYANGPTSICDGATATLSSIASNGNGPYSYSWTPTTGLNNSFISSPLASPLASTTYTVTVTDACANSQSASVDIAILPLPIANFSADINSGCAPVCVKFTNQSSANALSYVWNFGDNGAASTNINPNYCFENSGTFSISLTAISSGGCSNTNTISNLINVFANPEADFSFTPDQPTTLESGVTFLNHCSPDVIRWFWDFGDGKNSSKADPLNLYNPTPYSTYLVSLIVENINGCKDTLNKTIEIIPEYTFFIPNSFTPNGDGINDTFGAYGLEISTYNLTIFDRWGKLIFESNNLAIPWDGKVDNGKTIAQNDVYNWIIQVRDIFNQTHNYIGRVTLVK